MYYKGNMFDWKKIREAFFKTNEDQIMHSQ